jgi:hypothetical protein
MKEKGSVSLLQNKTELERVNVFTELQALA